MDFVFSKLIFTLKLNADAADPFALYSIRSDFQQTFQSAVCRQHGQCGECREHAVCPYYNTFSQALAEDPAALRRHQKPPLPFVFDLPVLPPTPNNGQELEIGLNLAGTATNFIEDYIAAVRILFSSANPGRKICGTITRVESLACSDFRSCLMENSGEVALDRVATISARDLMEMNTLNPSRIKFTIMSPMRILQDGRVLREFSFSHFVRSLLRRISSLAYYYYGNGLEVDFKCLSNASASVEVSENNFLWTEWQAECCPDRLSGIIGSGTCAGGLEDFYTFLLLGEHFHVGKGASFGLGRYRMEREF
jgi:CRISPR/Cas system CSM-associated protein Csm3 (group 7 of RAMP superfamily)